MAYLKECIGSSEFKVLPTEQDKWVSLHPSTGIVCCCDDKELRQQCKNMGKIDFIYFGEIGNDKTEVFQAHFSHLLKALGVPLLSEVNLSYLFCLWCMFLVSSVEIFGIRVLQYYWHASHVVQSNWLFVFLFFLFIWGWGVGLSEFSEHMIAARHTIFLEIISL